MKKTIVSKCIRKSTVSVMMQLVKASIIGKAPVIEQADSIDWDLMMDSAKIHGILAIVWDGICRLPIEQQPPRRVRINWGLSAQEIWDRYNWQSEVLQEIVQRCSTNGIKVLLMKSFGLSTNYPNPQSRPSGDIDIYLFGDYEKGNTLLSDGCMKVNPKHASFVYHNVMIENHNTFLDLNSEIQKDANDFLVKNVHDSILTEKGYYLMDPDCMLLFLLMHTASHLESQERVPLCIRTILDFSLFLKSNQLYLTPSHCYKLTDCYHVSHLFELMLMLGEWLLDYDFSAYRKDVIPYMDYFQAKELLSNPYYGQNDFSDYSFIQQFRIRMSIYRHMRWKYHYSISNNNRIHDFLDHTIFQVHVFIKHLIGYPETVPFFVSLKSKWR